jgi:hypothetical protein
MWQTWHAHFWWTFKRWWRLWGWLLSHKGWASRSPSSKLTPNIRKFLKDVFYFHQQ